MEVDILPIVRNCLYYNCSNRIDRPNWICPKCQSRPSNLGVMDGGSAVCSNRECRSRFHWCALKGDYEVEATPLHAN